MDTSSPEYMRECLIRTILGWKDRQRILAFIELWGKRHGSEAAEKLRADLNEMRSRGMDQVRR